jgi:hypothetical protein
MHRVFGVFGSSVVLLRLLRRLGRRAAEQVE